MILGYQLTTVDAVILAIILLVVVITLSLWNDKP